MLNINRNFLKSHNCYVGQNNPKYIIQHETDNTSYGAGARCHAIAQYNGNIGQASVHFYVDDKEIYQCLNIEDGSWNCGDGDGSSGINNRNTISIELCVNPDSDYNIARNNAIELCSYLLKERGWGIDRLKTHNNATGKWCPRKILDEGYWDTFKLNVNILLGGGNISAPPVVEKPQSSLDKAKEFVGGRCKELQEKLIQCGYSCGGYGADGVFGQGTYNSLIEFQREHCSMVDGLAGNETFSKLDEILSNKNNNANDNSGYNTNVESIQHLCNVVLGVGIAEDGIWGNQTDNAVRNLPLCGIPYTQPTCTKWIQSRLGIDVDGIFLYGTANAVGEFQRENSLDCDKIVGYQTYKAMALN